MADDETLRDQIARIEAEIERLADVAERCGKFMFAARLAAVAGAVLFLALMLGAIRFDPLAMVASLTAAIGGVVAYGANASTAGQARAAIAAAEAKRRELIDRVALELVAEPAQGRLLH